MKAAEFKKLQIDDEVKIISRTHGHDMPVGDGRVYLVESLNPAKTYCALKYEGSSDSLGYCFYPEELERAAPKTKEELVAEFEAELKIHKSKIAEYKSRLSFMEQTGAKAFDEDEFRVWQALQTLKEEGKSDYEKAKIIAGLVKDR